MATAETVGLAPPQHYLWWFPGSPVKVHLALGVVQRMKLRLPNTGSSSPEEGLLFGGTHEGATEILDFQPAAVSGVADMVGGLNVEKRRSLVGYYRIEEGEAFRLNAQDLDLARECFAKPYNVFLIVHTNRFGLPTATFFFHDRDCRMADFAFLEFPFDPKQLAAEQYDRIQRSQQAIDRPLAVLPPAPVPAPTNEVRRTKPRVFLKALLWTFALALVFTLGTVFNNSGLRERYSYIWRTISNPPSKPNSGNASSISAAQSPARPSMSLHAIRRNADLELTWNRDSAPIAAATSGTLSIQDGKLTRLVSLDATQLRDGSLLYFPRTDQILMRLTVNTAANTATESVTVILPSVGEPQTYPVPPPKDVSAATANSQASPGKATLVRPPAAFAAPSWKKVGSSPVAAVLQEPPALRADSDALGSAPNVVERLLSFAPVGPAAPAKQLPPNVSTYEPPVAVVKVQPAFSPDLRNLLVKRTTVEVKVVIDKNGKVAKAEAIPQANVSKYWLNSAVDAAIAWKFKPARNNHEPVWSEMILQFVFSR